MKPKVGTYAKTHFTFGLSAFFAYFLAFHYISLRLSNQEITCQIIQLSEVNFYADN